MRQNRRPAMRGATHGVAPPGWSTTEYTEDFLKPLRKTCIVVFGCGFVLLGLATLPLTGEQAQKSPSSKRTSSEAAHSKIWRSETTGKEYRVRVEKDRLYADWVDIAPKVARQGAYIRTECRRLGSKWIGTSRIYLPCTVGTGAEEHLANRCHFLMRMEIDSVTSDRITGRAETYKDFDCQTCKVKETVWGNFTWVPER